MITLTVITKVIPKKQQEFLQAVRSLTSCLDKIGTPTLYQKVDDQTVFHLFCELGTKEELRKFLSAEEFKMLLGAFRLLCERSKVQCRYFCRNWPRHACITHESLSQNLQKAWIGKHKGVDRKKRGDGGLLKMEKNKKSTKSSKKEGRKGSTFEEKE